VRGKKAIKSLKGIEYFTDLGLLDCSNTSVSTLDVRRNTDLWLLHATKAPLTRLKLGRKDYLGELHMAGTKLASIDIAGCPTQLEAATSPTWEFWVSKGVIYWEGKDPLIINTTTKLMKGNEACSPMPGPVP